MPFSQEGVADVLGVSSVHVNRMLKDLRAMSLLEIKNRRLMVPNVAKLRAYCDFDPSNLHLNIGSGATVGA